MKLEKIRIKNFRNYLGEITFDLSKDITILFGENGKGKSSFFDAIEWCVTGEIKRFSPINKNKTIIANSYMETGSECLVCLWFDNYKLERSFKKVDDKKFNNIKVYLVDLTTQERVPGESNVIRKLEDIVSKNTVSKWDNEMISQAYILSQSQINSFITQSNAKDRYDSLASIMGFNKVHNLKKNIKSFISEITNKKEMNSDEIKKINNKIDKLNKDRDFTIKSNDISCNDLDYDYDIEKISQQLSDIKSSYMEMESGKKELYDENNDHLNNTKYLDEVLKQKESFLREAQKSLEKKNTIKYEAEKSLEKLWADYSQIKTEVKLVEDKKVLSDRLKKLSDKLKENLDSNNIIDITQIDYDLQKYIQRKSKLEFALNNYVDYGSYNLNIKKISERITNLKSELQKLETKILLLENSKKKLSDEFSEGGIATSIEKLLILVEDASKFTKENQEYKDRCPVCDSQVENIENKFNYKLDQLLEKSGKYKEKIEDNINRRNILSKEIRDLESSKKANSQELKHAKKALKSLSDKKALIEDNILFDSELITQEEMQLTYTKDHLEKSIRVLNETKKIIEEIEKLKLELSLPKQVLLLDGNITPESIEKEISIKEKQLENLKIEIQELVQTIETEKTRKEEVFNKKNILEKFYEKHSVNDDINLKVFIDNTLTKLYKQEKYLENYLKKSHKIEEVNRLKKEITKFYTELEKREEQEKYFNDIISELQRKNSIIKSNFGEQTIEFLNSPNSAVLRYYQYLNPNPAEFQELFFDVKNDSELDIRVKNENNNEIVNYVLSSGQLNVLAISIFIATNTSQSFRFFDFIAIDDPIQNMDDVNRFSITDVLSNLQRQLIFSTHDIEYLNLFLKKNEHRLKDISVYNLASEKNIYVNLLDFESSR